MGFFALQTHFDLRAQFTTGQLNPSQVSSETGLAPELFGLGVSFSPSREYFRRLDNCYFSHAVDGEGRGRVGRCCV